MRACMASIKIVPKNTPNKGYKTYRYKTFDKKQ